MPTRTFRAAALVVTMAVAVLAARAAAGAEPADLVLVNGRILTVDSRDSVAEAVAVRAGRIVAVGSTVSVRRLAGPSTTVIDLGGRAATPGLIDTHAHVAEGGYGALFGLELGDAKSVAEIVRRVAERVKTLKPGEWLLGQGWDEGKLAEKRYVLARDLDAVAPDNPVWLEHTSGHYGTANSATLRLAGISRDSADPPAGRIDRDAAGEPTGVLKESAAMAAVTAKIPPPTPAQRRDGILASLATMNREGMTGVKDPSITADDWDAYAALGGEHRLTAHVCVLWYTEPTVASAEANIRRMAALPRPPAATGGGDLLSCGAKIFLDGSGGARTAWMYEDWNLAGTETDAGNRGFPLVPPDVFRQQVALYHAAGVAVGTHAIGDRAIDVAVDTYAAVLRDHPAKGLRHSIIHANIPSDHAIGEMARLQREWDAAYPESQATFTWWIGDLYAPNFGPVRSQRLNPFHTYLERGVHWGGGSDYPVTPLPARYGLWASVAREPLLGTYGRQPFGTKESVDVHAALRSYTVWAAHQLFIDGEAGSIEVGKSADIAVWDRNPYTVATADLKDMRCELTLYRGRVVYRREDSGIRVEGAAR